LVHPGIMPPMRTSDRTADPAVRGERMRVIPMRRPGEVDEVAYAILFLASESRPTSQVTALDVLRKSISVDVHTHGGKAGITSKAPPNERRLEKNGSGSFRGENFADPAVG
jgi:hypothetical protein